MKKLCNFPTLSKNKTRTKLSKNTFLTRFWKKSWEVSRFTTPRPTKYAYPRTLVIISSTHCAACKEQFYDRWLRNAIRLLSHSLCPKKGRKGKAKPTKYLELQVLCEEAGLRCSETASSSYTVQCHNTNWTSKYPILAISCPFAPAVSLQNCIQNQAPRGPTSENIPIFFLAYSQPCFFLLLCCVLFFFFRLFRTLFGSIIVRWIFLAAQDWFGSRGKKKIEPEPVSISLRMSDSLTFVLGVFGILVCIRAQPGWAWWVWV